MKAKHRKPELEEPLLSDPCNGFYADAESEYDIRHFIGPNANTRANIEFQVAALRVDGWKVAWTDKTKSATFMILRKPRKR